MRGPMLPTQFFAEVAEELRAVHQVPAISRLYPHLDLATQLLKSHPPEVVPLLEETECFPDDLAGRRIEAGLHLILNELLQFWGKGNVHRRRLLSSQR